ncbi:MAG: ATP-binding protein [Magnetococcales bacterium]|nr:ATP-binding protein [Magnetococcales bacterium]
MIRVRSFGCSQYKAFRDPVTVEVRPLTLFYGKNSSGKSAILRLLRLLLRLFSFQSNFSLFPMEIDGLQYGDSFIDLVHEKLPNSKIDFSLSLIHEKSGAANFDISLLHAQDAWNNQPLPVQLCLNNNKLEIPQTNMGESLEILKKQYSIIYFKDMYNDVNQFDYNELREWEQLIQFYESCLQHLGPSRAPIKSCYKRGQPKPLAFDGSGCINWLAQNKELHENVRDWFATHLDGWRLDLDSSGNMVECVLRKRGVAVNLADAGQGMQQILPVVVLQLAHQHHFPYSSPFLDLVEEPESSLHAAAQAALGDLFLETTNSDHGQVLVETHSENLLLRIRRRIAEGKADPSKVALYWVDESPEGYSTIRPILIQEDGSVDWWPSGIFSESYQEVLAINRANKERGRQHRGGE